MRKDRDIMAGAGESLDQHPLPCSGP
jgi:hypothetical protein